jgi:carbon monoxide dehydrogenase subunit G
MKIAGTANISHSPEKVFAALTDPVVLTKTLPGCQSLEQVGPDTYKMVITAGVASIKGSYLGQVELSDRIAPASFTMRAAGSGAPGTIQAVVKMSLTSEGEGTLLSYDADAVVGGVIAGVGQRVLGGVAKKTAGEFFKSIDRYLSGDTSSASNLSHSTQTSPPSQTSQSRSESIAPTVTERRKVESQFANIAFLTVGAAIALVGVVVGWLISH